MSPQAVVRRTIQRSLYLVVLSLVTATGLARAQEVAPPAYIAFVEGAATLEREGEVTPAVLNMPLLPGDRVRTGAGRVEIRFPDGTGIEVGEDSWIELVTETRVRLLGGTIDRLEPVRANTATASYLPQDLQMYGGTFDRYGTWRYAPDYGYVWYPMVAPDWRPYYYGYWEPLPRYGWTWIGADVWAWPTHHYGRWGQERNAWFWIPDRTFAAAWVSWGTAPGYVSWCPLGFNNRPVFASIGYGNSWSGWTILPRAHFGTRGYYAHRFAVDPRQLPRNTAFAAYAAPPVAPSRHVSNGAPVGAGLAVPRTGVVNSRQATANSRRSSVDAQQPIVLAPQPPADRQQARDRWSTMNLQRAGAYERRLPAPPPQPPQPIPAPSVGIPRVSAQPRPSAPPVGIPRVNVAPPPAPIAMPRAGAVAPPPPAQPAATPQAAPQRSAPSGGAHERSGGTAQPRGDGQRGGEGRRRG